MEHWSDGVMVQELGAFFIIPTRQYACVPELSFL
jgi:hypothetical protein